MHFILEKYLSQNNYFKISKQDLRLQLLSHPEYPSTKSITDTLDYFGVENIAAVIPKEHLQQLPHSFLAFITEKDNHALVSKKKEKITLHFEDGTKQQLSVNSFKEKWPGTIVVIEGAKGVNERTVQFLDTTVLLTLSVFLITLFFSFTVASFLLSVLSLAGVYLSYLIVKEEMGIHSATIAKVCGAVNKSGNCASVINAVSSKLFGISLSDLSVVFFAAFILINSLIGLSYATLLIVSVVSVPVILFSLYQQAFVLKQWCALCLGVISILLTQGIVIIMNIGPLDFSFSYGLRMILVFTLVYALWKSVKPIVISNLKLRKTEEAFLRFKRNHNLFLTALHSRPLVGSELIQEQEQIHFGADDPILTINAVTNPLCGFCTDPFKIYNKLLRSHPKSIRLNLIFSVVPNHLENKATQIAGNILTIYKTQGREKAWEAISEWFTNRDIESWQRNYLSPDALDKSALKIIESHVAWCSVNEINYTPATVIDGCFYPIEYQISDLPLLIDELILERQLKKEDMPISYA